MFGADPRRALARRARRHDIIERPERQRAPARDAGEDGDVEDADGEDRVGGGRAVTRGDQDRDDERGEGKDQVIAAHDHLIEQAAAPRGGRQPEGHADDQPDANGHHRHGDGGLAAHHQHRQKIAPELVGAQRMGGRGRLQPVGDGQGGDIMGCPDEADERQQGESRADRAADQKGGGKAPHLRLSLGSTSA